LIAAALDSGMASPPHFDHEKLDVYQLELKFLSWVSPFLADLSSQSLALTRELREQLDRASLPALLNPAEGNGRRQGRQRAKFFDDVRGSAIECAACLDASVAKGFASSDRVQAGKQMLIRVVAMLTKLLMRFDPEQYRVHESPADLAAPFEHEHEDEHEHEHEDEHEDD
jgi:four helix bundle protein